MPYEEDGETWSRNFDVYMDGMAENKPGHKKFTDYNLPSWARHPLTHPFNGIGVEPHEYAFACGDGIKDGMGWTTAHIAAMYGDMEMLQMAPREHWSQPDDDGQTPAWYAVLSGHSWIIQFLVENDCDTTSPMRHGFTPEDWTWRSTQLYREQKDWLAKAFEGKLTEKDSIKAQEFQLKKWRMDFLDEAVIEMLDTKMMKQRMFMYKTGTWVNPYPQPEKGAHYGKDLHHGVIKPGPRVGPQPLPVAIMFPGQGSQMVGMMKDAQSIPRVKEMLASAKEILGWDVMELCLNGPEEKLAETKYCQPVMFIAGLAGVEVMRKTKPEEAGNPMAVAGLSLGEYTALACAEVLSFEDALTLVKLRAIAMQEAADLKPQAMCSVAGLDLKIVEKLCLEAIEKKGGGKICQVANHLFPAGYTCAGDADAVDELCVLAKNARALQARVIKAGGAFHTPCMQPAKEKLEAAINEMAPKMQPPKFHIYFNVTGTKLRRGTDPKEFVGFMKEQLTSPVLWEQSVKNMVSDGIQEYYECGPNKQLTAMMKRIDANAFKRMSQCPV